MSYYFSIQVGETNLHDNAPYDCLLHNEKLSPLDFANFYNLAMIEAKNKNCDITPSILVDIMCVNYNFYRPNYVVDLCNLNEDQCLVVNDNIDKHIINYSEDVNSKDCLYYYKLQLGNYSYRYNPEIVIFTHTKKFTKQEFIQMYNISVERSYKSRYCMSRAYDIFAIMKKLFKFTLPINTVTIRTLNGKTCQPFNLNNLKDEQSFQYAVEVIDKAPDHSTLPQKSCHSCEYRYSNTDQSYGCGRFNIPFFPAELICSDFYYERCEEISDDEDGNSNYQEDCCRNFPHCDCTIE